MKSLCRVPVHFVIAWIGLAAAAAQAQDRAGDLYAGVKTVEVFANMAMQVTPVAVAVPVAPLLRSPAATSWPSTGSMPCRASRPW